MVKFSKHYGSKDLGADGVAALFRRQKKFIAEFLRQMLPKNQRHIIPQKLIDNGRATDAWNLIKTEIDSCRALNQEEVLSKWNQLDSMSITGIRGMISRIDKLVERLRAVGFSNNDDIILRKSGKVFGKISYLGMLF